MKKTGTEEMKKEMRAEAIESNFWYRTFGPFGPMLRAMLGMAAVFLGLYLLSLLYLPYAHPLIAGSLEFFGANIFWFFGGALVFSYSQYSREVHPEHYWLVSPLVSSITFAAVLVAVSFALVFLSAFSSSDFGYVASAQIERNLVVIFAAALIVGYSFAIAKRMIFH